MKEIENQFAEVAKASSRMGQLINIEHYETLDYAKELNVETLIKG